MFYVSEAELCGLYFLANFDKGKVLEWRNNREDFIGLNTAVEIIGPQYKRPPESKLLVNLLQHIIPKNKGLQEDLYRKDIKEINNLITRKERFVINSWIRAYLNRYKNDELLINTEFNKNTATYSKQVNYIIEYISKSDKGSKYININYNYHYALFDEISNLDSVLENNIKFQALETYLPIHTLISLEITGEIKIVSLDTDFILNDFAIIKANILKLNDSISTCTNSTKESKREAAKIHSKKIRLTYIDIPSYKLRFIFGDTTQKDFYVKGSTQRTHLPEFFKEVSGQYNTYHIQNAKSVEDCFGNLNRTIQSKLGIDKVFNVKAGNISLTEQYILYDDVSD